MRKYYAVVTYCYNQTDDHITESTACQALGNESATDTAEWVKKTTEDTGQW